MSYKDPEEQRAWDRERGRRRRKRAEHREYMAAYQKQYGKLPEVLAKQRANTKKYQKQRRIERHGMLAKIKSAPCMDCGRTFDPVCMDFDHRPGEVKIAAVARMLHAGTAEQFMAEIAKCDLVCACCHRLRTKQRRANDPSSGASP